MDKNTIIGLVIISILLIGYMFLSRPSKEEIAERQRVQDSIAHEQMVKEEEAKVAAELLRAEAEQAEKEAAREAKQAEKERKAAEKLEHKKELEEEKEAGNPVETEEQEVFDIKEAADDAVNEDVSEENETDVNYEEPAEELAEEAEEEPEADIQAAEEKLTIDPMDAVTPRQEEKKRGARGKEKTDK